MRELHLGSNGTPELSYLLDDEDVIIGTSLRGGPWYEEKNPSTFIKGSVPVPNLRDSGRTTALQQGYHPILGWEDLEKPHEYKIIKIEKR